MRDHRDLCIEALADSEAALLARIEELETERAAYRVLAQESLHALHALTRKYDRLTDRLRALVAELRVLRGTERRAA
jgi:hypothetical protein